MNQYFVEGFEKTSNLKKIKKWVTAPSRKELLSKKLKLSQKQHEANQKFQRLARDNMNRSGFRSTGASLQTKQKFHGSIAAKRRKQIKGLGVGV